MSTEFPPKSNSGALWRAISLPIAPRTARLQMQVERLVGPLAERRTGNDRRRGLRIRPGRRATD